MNCCEYLIFFGAVEAILIGIAMIGLYYLRKKWMKNYKSKH